MATQRAAAEAEVIAKQDAQEAQIRADIARQEAIDRAMRDWRPTEENPEPPRFDFLTNNVSNAAAIVSYANSADNAAAASSDVIVVSIMEYNADTGFFI